jgi:acetylornithine deacetylase
MSEAMAQNAAAAGPGDYDPNYTTLHSGTIKGGTASNITARDCSFTGEMRVMPNEPLDGWQARYRAEASHVEALNQSICPDTFIEVKTRMTTPGLAAETEGAAERLARGLTGDNGEHFVSYQTEAGQFQERNLSTVICGPGSILQAHQADEFISIEQLDAGEAFMRRLIERLSD